MYQKWPDQIFPIVNFVFSHNGHFGLGRGEGVLGEGSPPLWVLIIPKKPCPRGVGQCLGPPPPLCDGHPPPPSLCPRHSMRQAHRPCGGHGPRDMGPRGGGRARSLYATPPPSPPPPPPPGFERWWAGDMAPTAPPFFPPGANSAPFSSVSARFRKTRRYTNVVCCPDMLTANVSPRTRGPWHGMLPPTM